MVSLGMSRILISGASGLIGSALVPSLKAAGAHVTRLTRGPNQSAKSSNKDESQIPWDPQKPLDPDTVSGFDAVIHLAGRTIASRWTDSAKSEIWNSRIGPTRHLAQALAAAREKPKVLLSSSAIGYYGPRGDEILTEESMPGDGFAADVSREWEDAAQPAAAAGIRTICLRTGIVLSKNGGALKKLLPPFKMGVGGRVATGKQYMSWIDLQDMVGAIHHLLKADLVHGPVNLVAPKPVTNAEFTKTLAAVLHRPAIFPVPAAALRLMFGQMADELLIHGQRVEPTKLVTSGYPFRFRDLKASLEHVVKS